MPLDPRAAEAANPDLRDAARQADLERRVRALEARLVDLERRVTALEDA